MISFELREEELLAQSALRELVVDNVRPAAPAADRAMAIQDSLLEEVWDAGFVTALLDESGGDSARSRVISSVLYEELGWGDAALAVAIGAPLGFVQAVLDHGSPGQIALARQSFRELGFRAAALLVLEPGFGFDIDRLATRADPWRGGYRLNGVKSFVPLAARCAEVLVVARDERGLAAFIIPVGTQGVEFSEPGGTLGLRSVAFSQLRLRDVVLPASARLGEAAGCNVHALIASSRVAIGSILTGLSRAVFEHITAYTKERVAHGSVLAKKQTVAFRLADMFIDIPSMRWMCWQGASALEKGRTACREARLAQLHCGECAVRIADEGVQLMGGHGYMRDNPVERWYRDARTLSLLEGIVGV